MQSDSKAIQVETSSVTTGEFTRDVARLFNAETAHTLTTTSLKSAQLAATHMSSSVSGLGMSAPMPEEDAYVMALQLSHSGGAQLWKRGKHIPTDPFVPGSISLSHLSEQPLAYLPDPFECILFHLPRAVVDEMSVRAAMYPVGDLDAVDRLIDPVLYNLGLALVPAIADPQLMGRVYFDHVAHAIWLRIASSYGRFRATSASKRRVLSRMQERIAKELLVANLMVEPALADIADACRLPVRQFLDAFRNTVGMPPYRWLRLYRIERAKELMRQSDLTLAEVAYACGFADQSHFTRVFSAATGMTPGIWRRISIS